MARLGAASERWLELHRYCEGCSVQKTTPCHYVLGQTICLQSLVSCDDSETLFNVDQAQLHRLGGHGFWIKRHQLCMQERYEPASGD